MVDLEKAFEIPIFCRQKIIKLAGFDKHMLGGKMTIKYVTQETETGL